jgi:hypothetical protein
VTAIREIVEWVNGQMNVVVPIKKMYGMMTFKGPASYFRHPELVAI